MAAGDGQVGCGVLLLHGPHIRPHGTDYMTCRVDIHVRAAHCAETLQNWRGRLANSSRPSDDRVYFRSQQAQIARKAIAESMDGRSPPVSLPLPTVDAFPKRRCGRWLAKRSASLDFACSCLVAPRRLVDADVVHLNLARKDSRVGRVADEIAADRQIHDDEEGLIERRRVRVA